MLLFVIRINILYHKYQENKPEEDEKWLKQVRIDNLGDNILDQLLTEGKITNCTISSYKKSNRILRP